jgi:hypothetical protein
MRVLVSLLAVLALTACFDAEMVLDFKDETSVETIVTTKLNRALYDMSTMDGSDPCEGGTSTLTETDFACQQSATMTIDEAIARPNPFGKDGEFDPSEGMAIERIDDNTLRVTVNLDELDSPDNTPEELDGMNEMAAAAFAGHSIIFRVRGYEILDTTGTLSDDRKEASLVIPITGLMTGNAGVVSPFVTTVKLAKQCSFFGLFCD